MTLLSVVWIYCCPLSIVLLTFRLRFVWALILTMVFPFKSVCPPPPPVLTSAIPISQPRGCIINLLQHFIKLNMWNFIHWQLKRNQEIIVFLPLLCTHFGGLEESIGSYNYLFVYKFYHCCIHIFVHTTELFETRENMGKIWKIVPRVWKRPALTPKDWFLMFLLYKSYFFLRERRLIIKF
jgi:hypothetical protein